MNAQHTDAEDRRIQQRWGDAQAQEIVRRYVRSLERGGVSPLDLIEPTFTRADYTERSNGLLRRKVEQHRWVREDRYTGLGWLVQVTSAATLEKGRTRFGETEPDVQVPLIIVYDKERDELRTAVLLDRPGFKMSDIQGEMFKAAQGADEAVLEPRFIGERCDWRGFYGNSCRGECGCPLWADKLKTDSFSYLGVRATWYEDLPHGGFQEHSAPAGQGADALAHYAGPLFGNMDYQLRQQELSWSQ